MNRILIKRPDATPTTYVFGPSIWFVRFFRCMLLAAGCVTAWMSIDYWFVMPLTARVVSALLIPALLTWPIVSAPWQYTARFIANEAGMYFPAYPPLTLTAKMPRSEEWLEVSWEHIVNIRLASEVGEDGNCVAFDVEVSTDKKSKFFETAGIPRDRKDQNLNLVSVAYGGYPPSPAHAVQRLLLLRLHNKA